MFRFFIFRFTLVSFKLNMNNYIFNSEIVWHRIPLNNRFFHTYYENELYLLRLNNFPDENLITIIKEKEIIDLEDIPKSWKINY